MKIINKMYLFLTFSSFVFAYLAGKNLPYAVFYCFFIGFFISVFDIIIHYKAIDAESNFEKNIFETGDYAEYHIIVSNTSVFPASCVIVKNTAYSNFDTHYKGHAINFDFRNDIWIEYYVNFKLRGIYDFGQTTLTIKDCLSIFELTKKIDKSKIIKVYPKVHKLYFINMIGKEDFEALADRKGNIEDLSSVDDIRKYRFGDSFKRIHWKVSAKHGELYTKSFDTLTGQECNLLLDMNRISYFMENGQLIEEQLVEYMISVAYYMLKKHEVTNIFINNKVNAKFEIADKEDFESIKEYLILNKSEGENIFANFIDASSNEIKNSGWIGIFTPKITVRLKDSILDLKYLGYEVSVFYILNDPMSDEDVNDLIHNKVECVPFRQAAKEAQNSREEYE